MTKVKLFSIKLNLSTQHNHDCYCSTNLENFKLTVYKDLYYNSQLEDNLEKLFVLLSNDEEDLIIKPKSYSLQRVKSILYNYQFKFPFYVAFYKKTNHNPFNTILLKDKINNVQEFMKTLDFDTNYQRIHNKEFIENDNPECAGFAYLNLIDTKSIYRQGHGQCRYKLFDWIG